jgi:hypothetical protein
MHRLYILVNSGFEAVHRPYDGNPDFSIFPYYCTGSRPSQFR